MKTEQQDNKAQGEALFNENTDKLKRFMEENMPGAQYLFFVRDKEECLSSAMMDNEDSEHILGSVGAALAIFPDADKDDIAVSCELFNRLMKTLLIVAEHSPILLEQLKRILVQAAPHLEGIEIVQCAIRKSSDNHESKQKNAH